MIDKEEFKRRFPSLIDVEYPDSSFTWNEDIIKHCFDKQRAKEAIEKHFPNIKPQDVKSWNDLILELGL